MSSRKINRSKARERMVDVQLARRGIRDVRVLAAMRTVPRERFVDPGFEEFAYEDGPLPIAEGQTISQPYIVALMLEAAEISPAANVLEVGAGSGYAAAVLSRLARQVHAIERHAALADAARSRLSALGYDNVTIRAGDGTRGWPEAAPFDAILVAAASEYIPEALKGQLASGGHLIVPVGASGRQTLRKITRVSPSQFDDEDLGAVSFVPLISGHMQLEDVDDTRRAGFHGLDLSRTTRNASRP